jgi:hypothetical protein
VLGVLFCHLLCWMQQLTLCPGPVPLPPTPCCSLLGLLVAPACIERFGWPSVFYLFGGVGLLWTVWWERLMVEVSAGLGCLACLWGGELKEPAANS